MRLVEPQKIDENKFNDFINDFKAAEEDLVPYSLNQKDMIFKDYIRSLNDESSGKNIPENRVPASTYFLLDDEERICGAVNIRHRLTDSLRIEGGHVGYGIRPGARNRGYGTRILGLALDKAGEIGIKRVLLTCNKHNIYSAKIMENNGGKLDSEIKKGNKTVLRYWIKIAADQ